MSANEQNLLEASPEARLHYRIRIGAPGDGAYLKQWHGRDRAGSGSAARPMRWSRAVSQLDLPVVTGKPYEVSIELAVPKQAESPETGLYYEGKRIATIPPGAATISAAIPPSNSDRVTLELRCRGWVPKDTFSGSKDDRTLGLSVYSVLMRAQGREGKAFNANVE